MRRPQRRKLLPSKVGADPPREPTVEFLDRFPAHAEVHRPIVVEVGPSKR